MKKYLTIGGLILLLFSSSAHAIHAETMTELRDDCQKTHIVNPAADDIKAAAFCRGYIRTQADKVPAMFNCVPDNKVTVQELVDTFLNVLSYPQKYGFDGPNMVELIHQPPNIATPLLLMRDNFCHVK
jgi:hypothetical protein